MRKQIGGVCYRGYGHMDMFYDIDYGACGGRYMAKVYVEYPDGMSEEDVDQIERAIDNEKKRISDLIEEREEALWNRQDTSKIDSILGW
jgi:hypothetical protein